MTPAGSNFESMSAADGVSITEKGKNKMGKPARLSMGNSMTREEYLNETAQTFELANKTLDFQLPTLGGLKETQMDDTIELNSTIKSPVNESRNNLSVNKKLSESHQILPPIDSSRLNLSLGRNTSFAKTVTTDKVNMTERSMNFIKNSMISDHKQRKSLRGSQSMMSLKSSVPHNPPMLSKFNPIPPKINTGRKVVHKRGGSFGKIMTKTAMSENGNKKFDEFNRGLVNGSQELGGSKSLLKIARKPALNRTKNLSILKNPNLVNYEDKISKKAYLERIMDVRLTQKAQRYSQAQL